MPSISGPTSAIQNLGTDNPSGGGYEVFAFGLLAIIAASEEENEIGSRKVGGRDRAAGSQNPAGT